MPQATLHMKEPLEEKGGPPQRTGHQKGILHKKLQVEGLPDRLQLLDKAARTDLGRTAPAESTPEAALNVWYFETQLRPFNNNSGEQVVQEPITALLVLIDEGKASRKESRPQEAS